MSSTEELSSAGDHSTTRPPTPRGGSKQKRRKKNGSARGGEARALEDLAARPSPKGTRAAHDLATQRFNRFLSIDSEERAVETRNIDASDATTDRRSGPLTLASLKAEDVTMADDFNRLYERLVVRRTSKKVRVRRATAAVSDVEVSEDTMALLQASEAARLEELKRQEEQDHDTKIARTVKRLRFARNLRGFARLTHCSPHHLAYQLVDATEEEKCQFLTNCQRPYRRRHEERTSEAERSLRLEAIAARLFLRRAVAFRPDATTTLKGRSRVIDELLFFSSPNPRLLSQIGYTERGNIVPAPPLRLATK